MSDLFGLPSRARPRRHPLERHPPARGRALLIKLNGQVDPTLLMRPFAPDDASPLTGLLHAAYAELGAMGLNFTAVDQDVATTARRALGGQCWVVEQDGHIVGSLTVSLPPSATVQELTAVARADGHAWLNQVAVSPPLRGRGIASALWRQGRRWASANGASSIGVDTAIPATHLVQLYGAWGFDPVDSIHWAGKTYRSIIMVRELDADDA